MKILRTAAVGVAAALALAACGSGDGPTGEPAGESTSDNSITLWLAGGDTPDELREYLTTTFEAENPGSKLVIEQQDWGDLITKLTTALPDAANTPDVVELGNSQSSTFTNVGAFLDISDMYEELGGDKLLPGFVEAGVVDGANFTLPYYFGSRYVFYRKDLWAAAGVEVPKTLAEFNETVATIASAQPNGIPNLSGFWIGGQDWRNGISWIFANGGELAVQKDGQWTSTMSDPKSIKGLEQLQEIWTSASKAPRDAKDDNTYNHLNDSDAVEAADGTTTSYSLDAATVMAPGWAHWSVGDLVTKDGKEVREWNDERFGVFTLPNVDGTGPAPVFAGGSNIGISAKSQNPELAKSLMRIIFSDKYQQMLGENGLGPGNSDHVGSLGDDQFATALIESALGAKLTPAAPGWAALENSKKLEEFFGQIASGADVTATAKAFDAAATPILNGAAG
ncbi:extracellular solute-binding protein [Cellulomonas cellasea]|uniref:extracellular solute-binding protein n=1 Tax=Cellulomonas cellasea TaxID=43670 RepID=UPI0025A4045D|nr:extracellular solute-binding protein [Cellulomonas cellasea]MDM8083704.1 extracellular solute-binding protein [Cellulomonas cellasea]